MLFKIVNYYTKLIKTVTLDPEKSFEFLHPVPTTFILEEALNFKNNNTDSTGKEFIGMYMAIYLPRFQKQEEIWANKQNTR